MHHWPLHYIVCDEVQFYTPEQCDQGAANGATLAAKMVKFHDVPTLSGLVSFSPQFHSVFGRQYRVIKIHNNKARYVGAVTAKVVPKI